MLALAACRGVGEAPAEVETEPSVVAPPFEGLGSRGATVPLFGGTIATRLGQIAVADPETGHLWLGQADRPDDMRSVYLGNGSTPFRVALTSQSAFVTLRGTGEVAKVGLLSDGEPSRAWACAEPRGIAVDGDVVRVACASGELVTLNTDLHIVDSWFVASDLRDVVVEQGRTWVSRFRTAEVLQVDPVSRQVLDTLVPDMTQTHLLSVPHVGWRMRPHADGGVLLMHQAATTQPVEIPQEPESGAGDEPREGTGYGGDACDGEPRVSGHFTHVRDGQVVTSGPTRFGHVAYDFAVADRQVFALTNFNQPHGNLVVVAMLDDLAGSDCIGDVGEFDGLAGMASSLAMANDQLVVFGRNPSSLVVGFEQHQLGGQPPRGVDDSLALFHLSTRSGVSCVSCHPEGQDDGHVWLFDPTGPRRTQNLAGGVSERAPFHWDGDFASIDALMDNVFMLRMAGGNVSSNQIGELADWLDGIPTVASARRGSVAQVAAGAALFEHPTIGCAACHAGAQFTDGLLHTVRADGEPKKTPSLLGVGSRAPFMHDGCAATLEARFSDAECGGGDRHGATSDLGPELIAQLIAYLRSL